jgi:hypothetical protein
MPTNDPDVTNITQEALLEQLKRQHERICVLEARLAEGQQTTASENKDVPATQENWMAPEPVEEWPDPPPANLSQWVRYYTDALLDRVEANTPSSAPGTPETVSADEMDNYEPTLRFDSNRLHRAHRRLEAGRRGTGWRTSLTLMGLSIAALAFIQWQQHPDMSFLPASAVLQASVAPLQTVSPPTPASSAQTLLPLRRRLASLPAGSPATSIERSVPVIAHTLNRLAAVPSPRLAQTRLTLRRRHGNSETVSSPSRKRIAFALTRRSRFASANTMRSASARTPRYFIAKPRTIHLQVATAAPMREEHTRSQTRLASFSASHTDPRSYELASSRGAELPQQATRSEALTVAQPPSDIEVNVGHAKKTVEKMLALLDRMEQHRKKSSL